MKAVGYAQSHPIDHPHVLEDIERPNPVPKERDILVKVEAVSVNPVDAKIRQRAAPESGHTVLGFDAVGVVEACGAKAEVFKPGDLVWYAGCMNRQGSNAQYQCVDERIASLCPTRLAKHEAAAMPLASITAWELLFDRLQLDQNSTGHLLVVGGAGGVGSMLIQLAKALTQLTVIATASRPESRAWVEALGADVIVDHSQPLAEQLNAQGIDSVGWIASLSNTDQHLADFAELIAPQGRLGLIDDPATFDILAFKRKSVSIHWEFMFTRPLFNTDDQSKQRQILAQLAQLVDAGKVRSNFTTHLGTINAANVIKGHRLVESGHSMGKAVCEGFD